MLLQPPDSAEHHGALPSTSALRWFFLPAVHRTRIGLGNGTASVAHAASGGGQGMAMCR